jgi:thiaminase
MRHLIESVRTSLQEENWYAALSTALMLPDVCTNLEKGRPSTSTDYIAWCDTYVLAIYEGPPHNLTLPGVEIYVLR